MIKSLSLGKSGGLLALAVMVLAVAAVACGGGSDSSAGSGSDSGVSKITATDRIYTIEDFKAAGFKVGKTYDTEGLEGVNEVVYGFFGPDPYNRQEYEIRFYPSHSEAVNLGVSYADEATGEDAVLLQDVQRYTEGLTERRQCAGNGGHHSGKCDNAKYGDYVVVGNMILMCQGKDTITSQENCSALLSALQ